MTLATVVQCDETTARALTDQLRQATSVLGQQYLIWEGLVIEVYQREAWRTLAYESWRDYVVTEIPQLQNLRFGHDERRQLVVSFSDAGMSTRAIGAALGVGVGTVHRDQASPVPSGTPDDEPVDAEIVDEPAAPAEHPAQSDADYHRQAADIEAQLRAEREQAASTVGPEPARSVLGTDGKTYSAPAKPTTPRRRPLPEQFWQAAYDLSKVTERIERLADDDRFPTNADQVATANRSDLIRAIDALQGVVNRLPSA